MPSVKTNISIVYPEQYFWYLPINEDEIGHGTGTEDRSKVAILEKTTSASAYAGVASGLCKLRCLNTYLSNLVYMCVTGDYICILRCLNEVGPIIALETESCQRMSTLTNFSFGIQWVSPLYGCTNEKGRYFYI